MSIGFDLDAEEVFIYIIYSLHHYFFLSMSQSFYLWKLRSEVKPPCCAIKTILKTLQIFSNPNFISKTTLLDV